MDMIELIDRAAVIAAITSFCRADNDCKEFEGEACRGCEYYFCVREISKLPTIDAAPVRRGEWVMKPTGRYRAMQAWCSMCGKHSGIGGIESNQRKPFCPNCGADMREGGTP